MGQVADDEAEWPKKGYAVMFFKPDLGFKGAVADSEEEAARLRSCATRAKALFGPLTVQSNRIYPLRDKAGTGEERTD